MEIFRGSGVAIVTPFNKDGNIDYDSFKRLIDFQIEGGSDAIIVCGTTGESATLSYQEHNKLIEECINYVNGRVKVIAGTGSNCTKTAIRLSRDASCMGADGLLIVTPYYNKTTQNGLINHYSKIADSVDIPIILYNVPTRTGCDLLPSTVSSIVKRNENVIGIKEASGNINRTLEIKELLGDAISVYSGNDDQIVPILSCGGVGVISVLANIAPSDTHDMVMKYLNGDVNKSKELQLKSLKLIKSLFSEVNPIPVKKALEVMGMINGTLREPLIPMEEENSKKLIKEMKNYGIKF